MSKITACFNALKAQHKKALIPFITAGDPSADVTVELLHELVKAGADMIELGLPFSDPMADGPVIQRAVERALQKGINTSKVFDIIATFRTQNTTTPIILMTYLNPIEAIGHEAFIAQAAACGVDGLIVVDLPPEESQQLRTAVSAHHMDLIFLSAPTTSVQRLAKICAVSSGFLYYVALKGVTGSDRFDNQTITEKLANIRKNTPLPIGVGFGIKNVTTAQYVARISDAVVVGSALVERIGKHAADIPQLKQVLYSFVLSLRKALDNL